MQDQANTVDYDTISAELTRAHAREAAMREILSAISRYRDDVQPVLECIARNAGQLCNAPDVGLHLVNEARTHTKIACVWGPDKGVFPVGTEFDLSGTTAMAAAIREARTEQIRDFTKDPRYLAREPGPVKKVEEEGVLTFLCVPFIQNGIAIGCVNLNRYEVKPFTEDEIALLETFAAQAVIAIENVRQFREVQKRLDREAAMREVLDVISRSRDDERPVFQAIVDNAARLLDARDAGLMLVNESGSHCRLIASVGANPDTFELGLEVDLSSPLQSTSAIRESRIINIPDVADDPLYQARDPIRVKLVEVDGIRSRLSVPLLKDGVSFGCINLGRAEVRPFTETEIGLIETFAAQAVIAIENVRQFREVQTRLEREQATSHALGVISRSREDEAPVFDVIIESASRLSNSYMGTLFLVSGDGTHLEAKAWRNTASQELVDFLLANPTPLTDHESSFYQAIQTRAPVHILDARDTERYRNTDGIRRRGVDKMNLRTMLQVPLFRDDEPLGLLSIYRDEVRAFTPDEIAMVETFAAQAVIAIENVRQFREVQTRLEREQASGEVLEAISGSRADEMPVFYLIIERAMRLCNAVSARLHLRTEDGKHGRSAAMCGEQFVGFEIGFEYPLTDPGPVSTSFNEARVINIRDIADEDLYRQRDPIRVKLVEEEGLRSYLVVPLVRDGIAIGVITLSRKEVRAFSQDEVSLVETFAAQAVIAIENVRQFREVQTRLEREAASAQILEAISTSRDDEAPVFDLILNRAAQLCHADAAALALGQEGDTHQRLAASYGVDPRTIAMYDRGEVSMDPDISLAARAIFSGEPVHVEDMAQTEGYLTGVGQYRSVVDHTNIRTNLFVPLMTERGGIGVLILWRTEVRPYTDDEIALVQTFAAQAVIAIENVRQFKALETLNAELGERVDEQVGEIERIGKLKRFLPAAVVDTVVSLGSEDMLKSHRALLGVLFCDIRGFTAFCETAEPEETIEVLQTYHEEMGKLISAHTAGVDHRMGDGIMVLFNDPIPCDDPAGDAVRLAIAMRARMSDLCRKWKRMGYRLGFGVGVSLGYGTVGMVGFEGRFDYTASGTAINLASRLCDEAEDGEILLSPKASIAVEDEFLVESRGELSLKGLREPLEVFRLLDAADT